MSERHGIGLYGGTFNPIHVAHLTVAQEIWLHCRLQRVIFIPSYNPPIKREGIVSFADRVAMIKLAIGDSSHLEISEVETRRQGPSYTLLTLMDMQAQFPGSELFFIAGIDTFLDLPNWHLPEQIVSTTSFIVTTRPPWRAPDLLKSPFIQTPEEVLEGFEGASHTSIELPVRGGKSLILCKVTPLEIASSTIRELTRLGKDTTHLLHHDVHTYINVKGLYKSTSLT
ncbi:MAG: nicotinate (nicotinamide) nucleotide adenylyltransferase [Nitrospirae bacterium]|uniref:nicotinate (nicotinamide) nucleotide adenylyltransferase n=1 Tax=Candidatus Magnetobacterium casense TaxID=1455061 RepID=UPI00058F7844|nr:nicotinate (nicotinamide) nucleotide adenylyltransferase [Candidatus Magnetobacterium casensis]MBF0338590.1 nicotinate (nicotinamide) nucleotide adenylyltransferase [Nitrospirota bacterium]